MWIFVCVGEGPSATPAKPTHCKRAVARVNFQSIIRGRIENRFHLVLRHRRDRFASSISVFKLLAVEKIGRNRDDSVFGQLIAHAAQPIGQAKNFLNDQHGWGFVFALRINDKRLDRLCARFDIDPLAVTRRTI